MQQWEYCYVSAPNDHIYYFSTNQQVEMGWNEAIVQLGMEGWELVAVINWGWSTEFYFKRPLEREIPKESKS